MINLAGLTITVSDKAGYTRSMAVRVGWCEVIEDHITLCGATRPVDLLLVISAIKHERSCYRWESTSPDFYTVGLAIGGQQNERFSWTDIEQDSFGNFRIEGKLL